ncbi:hypothetical protein LSAT2_028689 [Lamellibrachia satsuma]|nr:hypothetical protein LSAT2_028689 [Lamellibrachia satsuma]
MLGAHFGRGAHFTLLSYWPKGDVRFAMQLRIGNKKKFTVVLLLVVAASVAQAHGSITWAHYKLLAAESAVQGEVILKLTSAIADLRMKIATIESDGVGGSDRSAVNLKQCSKRGLDDGREHGLLYVSHDDPLAVLREVAVLLFSLRTAVLSTAEAPSIESDLVTPPLPWPSSLAMSFESCDFVKKRDDTVLRVVWNGGSKVDSMRRWFFTINGEECKEPRTIDVQLYSLGKGLDFHKPAYVEGYCRGIPSGVVQVAWNVGDIVDGDGWYQKDHNVGDSYTGWASTVRIIVEEVDMQDAETVIV